MTANDPKRTLTGPDQESDFFVENMRAGIEVVGMGKPRRRHSALILFGLGAIIAAILILLGIRGDGAIEAPLYQRVLEAVPFIAFGIWTFYDIPLLFGKDNDTKRKGPPWQFTVFVVVSILVLFGFHMLLFDMLLVAFDYWLAFFDSRP